LEWESFGASKLMDLLFMNVTVDGTIAVFEDGEKIPGDVVLRALNEYAVRSDQRFMLDIYDLLGDPALQMK
jgi:hypothetical protein